MYVGLLSGQVFSPSEVKGERSGSPGTKNAAHGFRTNGMPALQAVAAAAPADERILWWARGDIGGGVHRGSELGAVASLKAVWWGMRLARLLTHLFVSLYGYGFLTGGKRKR